MIVGIAWEAAAAPVLEDPEPGDRFARCVEQAGAAAADLGWAPGAPARSDRLALVVGVPCHESSGIPSLAYSTRDAVRIALRLEAAGFEVLPLVDAVGRADLDAAIDRAEALLEPGGTLVVYFSGHGVLREEEGRIRRYLVLSDTDLADVHASAVPVTALEERIARIPAQARVVVQDTCFAARPGGKSVGLDALHEKGLALPEPGARLVAGDVRLYASRFYEQAIESPERRASVYTWHLLDGLDRADADLDGDLCVGLVEAHEWAARRTEEERHGFQVPQLRGEDPPNVLLGCTPAVPTRAVVRAPVGDSWAIEVAQGGEVVGRGTLALEPGVYRVRIGRLEETATDVVERRVLSGPVRVRAGQWLDLREEIDRRAPYTLLEAVGTLRGTDEVPDLAGGLAGWWAARDRGAGRPALGVVVRGTSGRASHEAEALARAGWWFTRGALEAGPVLAFGGLVRATRDADGAVLSTGSGNMGEAGLRAQLALGRLTISAEGGARVLFLGSNLPTARGGTNQRLDTAAWAGVALGGKL